MFTVDQVIQDKYPSVAQKPLVFKALCGTLKYLLHETEFKQFHRDYPHLDGIDFVEKVLEYFNFSYQISNQDYERIPAFGRVVIVANHPIGSLDGLALIKLVHDIRKDVKIIANDLLMSLQPLHKVLLPVNNMNGSTPKQNLNAIQNYLEGDGAVIIFPAGEVSRAKLSGVKDGKWHSGFVRMARAAKAPILPMFVDARNSLAFYLASAIYKPMATLLLVKEMFKQRQKTVTIKVGNPIVYDSYANININPKQKAQLFRKHLYAVAAGKKLVFETETSVAHPEKPLDIFTELKAHELLGKTPDNKDIYLCKDLNDSVILREIGRLREIAFRAVGEGTGKKRDTDIYDRHYYHLVLWDNEHLEIVGAYRFCDTKTTLAKYGCNKLYTATLFNFNQSMDEYLAQGLELGRSFVQPKYWGKRSLDYLWFGIGAFVRKHPDFRYLFGPVSISNQMPQAGKDLLIYFYQSYFSDAETKCAQSFHPYNVEQSVVEKLKASFSGDDYRADFILLKSLLANMGCSIPTLYKQYTELCDNGGVKFLDFGTDPDFADCVDGLVLVDLMKLKDKKRKRYIG
ncbi:MAG: lysophospholipid acyltransferase family protein [Gammaproteobacteria bacterium]|nr:lysophospholipid acyltransferase family protein [Gammaproteobacteria bacterium]